MNENLRTNKKGIQLIKEFEGFREKAYICPAGKWTIGYGFTSDVKEGDMITEKEAEERLVKELTQVENEIKKVVKVPLNGNQFSALVSFVYNLGIRNFKNSTLLAYLNKNRFEEVAKQLLRWNKAGGKELPGLARRRKAERDLFLS